MNNTQNWYIVKGNEGHCEILTDAQVKEKEDPNIVEQWGPYGSLEEAIARRIGLIRAGKCKPQ
jgi:hypothetical protein